MNININIEYNKLSEYRRFVQICLQIQRGFYQSKRFFLSHKLLKYENRLVHIPDVDISSIPDFWDILKNSNNNPYITDIKVLVNELDKKNIHIPQLTEVQIEQTKRDIASFVKEPIKELARIFPQMSNKEINILVRPTLYGTVGSFERATITQKSVEIEVTYRVDTDLSHLLEIILSSLVFGIKYEKNRRVVKWQEDWEINESIVDFFLQKTILSKYAPNYVGTMDLVENPEVFYQDLIANSKEIYQKLGYPINTYIEVKDDMIFINGELPKKPFTEAEKRIITTLVDRKGRLITNDELQDILWQGNYDKYSLWALAKTMQRIREKMRSCGIASEIIQTVRGKGYLIYD
jgi:hypothetical protein